MYVIRVRTALVSVETISHQSLSTFSVEKFMTVPWKFNRERMICSASVRRRFRSGMSLVRLRMFIQSSTAEVGQRLGSMVTLERSLALALPRWDSASIAASLRR